MPRPGRACYAFTAPGDEPVEAPGSGALGAAAGPEPDRQRTRAGPFGDRSPVRAGRSRCARRWSDRGQDFRPLVAMESVK
ncbi:hypothetical protein GCM10010273_25470 [Streptomyces lavendulocolor]